MEPPAHDPEALAADVHVLGTQVAGPVAAKLSLRRFDAQLPADIYRRLSYIYRSCDVIGPGDAADIEGSLTRLCL